MQIWAGPPAYPTRFSVLIRALFFQKVRGLNWKSQESAGGPPNSNAKSFGLKKSKKEIGTFWPKLLFIIFHNLKLK